MVGPNETPETNNKDTSGEKTSHAGLILLGVDDSPASLKLIDFVAEHFKKGHEFVVTHVHCKELYPLAAGAGGAFFAQHARDVMDREAEEKEVLFLKQNIFPRLEAAGVKFKTELVRTSDRGSSAISTALCKRAEMLKPEFLVLSKHSKSSVAAFFVGSVTQECIRRAPCPVVIV